MRWDGVETSHDVGTGLLSAVRMHLPSASTMPLQRPTSEAASSQTALRSLLTLTGTILEKASSSSTTSFRKSGFIVTSAVQSANAEVTMEPDPDGRHACDLQSARRSLSERNRDNLSD